MKERKAARKLEARVAKKTFLKASTVTDDQNEKQALLPSAGPGIIAPGAPASSKPQLIDDRKLPHPNSAPPGGVPLITRLPPGQLSMLLQV
jgi:hypothetical protein